MEKKKSNDQKVDVNFESHPPIESDLDGISALLKQTFLNFVDCQSLARYLIELKDVTQVIALEAQDEENTSDDDEPDNDIYGVVSIVELKTKGAKDDRQLDARKKLTKYLLDKFPDLKKLIDSDEEKLRLGLVVNERYINLPPQMSVPTLTDLTKYLDKSSYTHLIFVTKILLKARNSETKLPSKKSKSGHSSKVDTEAEPLVFLNAEEEIIFEGSKHHVDIDVSSLCDENATWSMNSDIKYIPHRRILIIDYKDWHSILKNIEKEL